MNPTSISIISTVINGVHDVKTIKKINRVKDWQFNELVKKLVQDGFIKKEGNALSLQKNAKVALLKKIANTWNLERLLRNSNDLVFSYLTESLTVNEILTKTGLSTATVYRALSDLSLPRST